MIPVKNLYYRVMPHLMGAVLSHIVDGKERPISNASRTLAPAERNYAQLDKEGAAVILERNSISTFMDRNSRF